MPEEVWRGGGGYINTSIMTPEEKFEDSKRVTRSREPKKGRQYNENTILDGRTNNGQ